MRCRDEEEWDVQRTKGTTIALILIYEHIFMSSSWFVVRSFVRSFVAHLLFVFPLSLFVLVLGAVAGIDVVYSSHFIALTRICGWRIHDDDKQINVCFRIILM